MFIFILIVNLLFDNTCTFFGGVSIMLFVLEPFFLHLSSELIPLPFVIPGQFDGDGHSQEENDRNRDGDGLELVRVIENIPCRWYLGSSPQRLLVFPPLVQLKGIILRAWHIDFAFVGVFHELKNAGFGLGASSGVLVFTPIFAVETDIRVTMNLESMCHFRILGAWDNNICTIPGLLESPRIPTYSLVL